MRISVGRCTHKYAREPCISLLQLYEPRGYLPSAFKGISKPLLVATTRACPDQIDYSRVLPGCLTRAGLVTRPWSELAHSLPACSARLTFQGCQPSLESQSLIRVVHTGRNVFPMPLSRVKGISPNFVFYRLAYSLYY